MRPTQAFIASWMERVLYLFAALLIGRAMIHQNPPDFDLHNYAHGTGPMPFQARYLMVPVLRWAEGNAFLIRAGASLKNSVHGPMELALQAVDSLCLILLGWLTPRVRAIFEPRPMFWWLSRWLLLWIVAITYVVRDEQSMFLPYDMVALLLFNVAVYFALRGNLTLYVLTVAVAMFNRETTVFTLFVWLVCMWDRSRWKAITGAAFTAMWWLVSRWEITRILGRPQTRIESALRVNVSMLIPHHWPQLLSIGGFLLVPLLVYRKDLKDQMLRRVTLGMVPWFLAALYFGWWNETRVFGEMCVLVACAAAVLFEVKARQRSMQPG